MPSVRELITTLKNDFAPSYNRDRIREYLDKAQRALFNKDCAQTIWLNYSDDTFPLPFLVTTEGKLGYDINTASFVDSDGVAISSFTVGSYTVTPRKVRTVFQQWSTTDTSTFNRAYLGESFTWAGINDNWMSRLARLEFRKAPAHISDKTGLRGPYIQFYEDPGATTDTYYVEFYYGPLELTSESIPLSIDADVWEEALTDGVVGYLEDSGNGNSERLNRFRTYWQPKFITSMNANIGEKQILKFKTRMAG